MKKRNEINWVEPILKFNNHFGYDCQIPRFAEIESEKDFKDFSDVVNKCIADNFDYTIEKYGTVPPAHFGLPKIIID